MLCQTLSSTTCINNNFGFWTLDMAMSDQTCLLVIRPKTIIHHMNSAIVIFISP